MRNSVGASPLPPLFAITIREEKPKIPNYIEITKSALRRDSHLISGTTCAGAVFVVVEDGLLADLLNNV